MGNFMDGKIVYEVIGSPESKPMIDGKKVVECQNRLLTEIDKVLNKLNKNEGEL